MPWSVRHVDGWYRIYNIKEKRLLKPHYKYKRTALSVIRKLYAMKEHGEVK